MFPSSLNVRNWPVVAFHQCNLLVRRTAACRRKRSFKDGLTEQMNSFDECRLSPTSGRSPNQKVALVKGNKRPIPDVQRARKHDFEPPDLIISTAEFSHSLDPKETFAASDGC